MNTNQLLKIIILPLICFRATAAIAISSPEEVIEQYIDAIRDQDQPKAQSLWLPGEIERSQHLGINYRDIQAKYDCASPLIFGGSLLTNIIIGCNYRTELINPQAAKVDIDIILNNGDTAITSYYLVHEENNWRICSSPYIYTREYYRLSTKYFNLHFSDSSLINDYAIGQLDNCVERIAGALDIPVDKIRMLEKLKIDYYLGDKNQMKLLTGHDAEGMTSLPFDAIITRHLPHEHELVHLLINYSLQDVPLFTLPIVQEGLACCIGGRWGKTASVINYWGAAVQTLGLVELDSLLTYTGFNSCPVGPDAAYAVSSLFTQTLIDNYGIDRFIEYYKILSGDVNYVNNLSTVEIIRKAESSFQTKWPDINDAYLKTVESHSQAGIAVINLNNLEQQAFYKDADNNLLIGQTPDYYIFKITLPLSKTNGSILMGDNRLNNNKYSSWQFQEHHPDMVYAGEIYGIQFSDQEAGLYNYLTNMLTAKYVYGFFPNSNYYSNQSNIIIFAIDKSLFDYELVDLKIQCLFND